MISFVTADFMDHPAGASLSVTFGLVAGGVLLSQWQTQGQPTVAEPT